MDHPLIFNLFLLIPLSIKKLLITSALFFDNFTFSLKFPELSVWPSIKTENSFLLLKICNKSFKLDNDASESSYDDLLKIIVFKINLEPITISFKDKYAILIRYNIIMYLTVKSY